MEKTTDEEKPVVVIERAPDSPESRTLSSPDSEPTVVSDTVTVVDTADEVVDIDDNEDYCNFAPLTGFLEKVPKEVTDEQTKSHKELPKKQRNEVPSTSEPATILLLEKVKDKTNLKELPKSSPRKNRLEGPSTSEPVSLLEKVPIKSSPIFKSKSSVIHGHRKSTSIDSEEKKSLSNKLPEKIQIDSDSESS